MPGQNPQPPEDAENPGDNPFGDSLQSIAENEKLPDDWKERVDSLEGQVRERVRAHKHAQQLYEVMKAVKRKIYLNDQTLGWNEVEMAVNDVLANVMGHERNEQWVN